MGSQYSNKTVGLFSGPRIAVDGVYSIKYIRQAVTSLRGWFDDTLLRRKAKITDLLELVDGDVESEHVPGDVFSRIVLASEAEADTKNSLLDSEIVSLTSLIRLIADRL